VNITNGDYSFIAYSDPSCTFQQYEYSNQLGLCVNVGPSSLLVTANNGGEKSSSIKSPMPVEMSLPTPRRHHRMMNRPTVTVPTQHRQRKGHHTAAAMPTIRRH
jgi:hypothetical protein